MIFQGHRQVLACSGSRSLQLLVQLVGLRKLDGVANLNVASRGKVKLVVQLTVEKASVELLNEFNDMDLDDQVLILEAFKTE